ncbi:MAG: hypothetical protein QNJ12_02510 [Ilumatobacter sp.]|uniref:hypothetical protein n=1 Tax=Ilumatobacter sp. TaxID=1967498 RepID=UPI0026148476|nr:hypothetical protein [Ilumatobacter sp.]MDJ0767630.1 hypothetical protein [Ilumatobacter sp.]
MSVELGPVPFSVVVRHPLLVPVERVPGANGVDEFVPVTGADGVSVDIDSGTLGWSSNGMQVDASVVVTVPPFEIGGTGLVVGLDEARFVLREADWIPEIGSVGFDSSFRGVYAEAATVYWLHQLQLDGADLPGVRLDFERVAVGTPGVSFDVTQSWEVAVDPQGRLGDDTELLGSLFSWQVAIESATGSVRANLPESFAVTAVLDVPFFDALFEATFGLAYRYDDVDDDEYDVSLRLAKRGDDPLAVSFPGVDLTVRSFEASGVISDDGFAIDGLTSLVADLAGFTIDVASARAAFRHVGGHDRVEVELVDVELGQLGTVDRAELLVAGHRVDDPDDAGGDDGDGGYLLDEVAIAAEFRWDEISHLIPIDDFDIDIPDDGHIAATITWRSTETDTGTDTQVVVELRTGVSHLDDLWSFLPDDFRPEAVDIESFFRLTYRSVDAFTGGASTADTDVEIELSAKVRLRLPPGLADLAIPGFDLLDVTAGDDEGIIAAEFVASYVSEDDDTSFSSGLQLEDVIGVEVDLPGGRAAEPFVATQLTKAGLTLGSDDGDVSAGMLFEGEFAFRPFVPAAFPFAAQLQGLLHGVGLDDVVGRAALELSLADDDWWVALRGEFDSFGVSLDVFDVMSALASGGEGGGNDIDIDFEIGFSLIGFEVAFGTAPPGADGDDADDGLSFRFDLTLECRMTGLPPLRARIRLSDEEFSLGLTDVMIPLEIPEYPIGVADLERLRGTGTNWTGANLETFVGEIDVDIADLEAAPPDGDPFERAKDVAALELKKALLQIVMAIHDKVGPGGATTYESLVVADTAIHETVLGLLHVDTTLRLHFPSIQLRIPFDDPSGIALEGTGRITGFGDDDPFKPIENFSLTLGLSSEYVYARLESFGDPIPLPSFGTRYDDGSIAIKSLGVGYGYNKNSFAFDFEGELVMPSALVEDADTSDVIGAGVRLPRFNSVFFKLDTMVITVGKVTLVIPVPQFDIDLRSPGSLPLVSSPTGRDRPYWDGLEVIAHGVVHADVKRIAFSPFFGLFILPNARFDGDLDIGTETDGMTLIVDELLVLFGMFAGSAGLMPVYFLADPTQPYFDNIAANLRVAGFEINFTMQRPFPSPSPLAAIEAFGLLSNPMMQIDPDGALANTIRFTLDKAYLRVPEHVVEMFPAIGGIVEKQYGFTLNLETLISMVQAVAGAAGPVIDGVRGAAEQGIGSFTTAVSDPDAFDPWRLVAQLPPELRKFRTAGQLAGFSASACFVLATDAEARASLEQPDAAAAASSASSASSEGVALAPSRLDGRRLVAADESVSLFRGIEFRQFTVDDLDLEPDSGPAPVLGGGDGSGAVFVGARVRVLGKQRLRFLGRMYGNGSFALVASASAAPLELSVFGLRVPIVLAGDGRIWLVGSQQRSGYSGRVQAEGWIDWAPIPSVVRLEVGSAKTPARLALFSDGRFELAAGATVTLFDGAAAITGSARVTNELAAFAGRLAYAPMPATGRFPSLIELHIDGAGHVAAGGSAPGARSGDGSVAFAGRGTVTVLGETFAEVEVRVADRFASFELMLGKQGGSGSPLVTAFPVLESVDVAMRIKGEVDLRRASRPAFTLEGEGRLGVLGAEIVGAGAIRALPASSGGASHDRFELAMRGDLYWHGRKWLGGHVRVGSEGLAIGGSANIGLEITPGEIPGTGVDVAHLFLELQIDADFSVDVTGQQASFMFRGAWTLGAGLPGSGNAENRQILPLASSEFVFDSSISTNVTLLDFDGFALLPIGDIQLPVPVVTVDPAEGAKTMVKAGTKKDSDDVPLVQFWTPFSNVGIEGEFPFAYVGSRRFESGAKKVYDAYDISVSFEEATLPVQDLADLRIVLSLDDSDGAFPLRLLLESGSQQRVVTF